MTERRSRRPWANQKKRPRCRGQGKGESHNILTLAVRLWTALLTAASLLTTLAGLLVRLLTLLVVLLGAAALLLTALLVLLIGHQLLWV